MRNPAARLEIGADVETAIVQFDAEMRKIIEYRAGLEPIAPLYEPLIDDNQLMVASGRLAPIAVGKPAERRHAFGAARQIDDADRQFSNRWTR